MGGREKPVEVALQMELEVSAAATATRITHARQSSSACQQISERRQGAREEWERDRGEGQHRLQQEMPAEG